MREDKSLCKCYGRKHKSLAYNWLLGRAMVLGSLGVLFFWVIEGQGPVCCACIFSLIYPVFLCLFPFSADVACFDYNVVERAVDWVVKLQNKLTNEQRNKQTVLQSSGLKALIIIHALK